MPKLFNQFNEKNYESYILYTIVLKNITGKIKWLR